MSDKIHVLFVNCLDRRYGIAQRARSIYQSLNQAVGNVTYLDTNNPSKEGKIINIYQEDNMVGYLAATIKRAYFCFILDYKLIFIMKLNLFTLPCILAAKIRGKTIIVDCDDVDSEFQKTWIRKFLTRCIEKYLPRWMPYITTHNNLLKKHLEKNGAKNVFIIPQAVDTMIFDPSLYHKEESKKQLGLMGKKVVSYLCTLTEGGARDLDKVISNFKEISDRVSDSYLLIIGGGLLEDKYRILLDKLNIYNASITGTILHEKVPLYLSASDVGVVYFRENLGNSMRFSLKVLEYLAMNIPVVGKINGITKGIFKDQCKFYEEDNKFVNGIVGILDINIEERETRKYIVDHFSQQICDEEVNSLNLNQLSSA